jgi:HSP20 family protein
MNELRIPDPFDFEPMEAAWRRMLRPWRWEAEEGTPQIKLEVSEHDDSYLIKAEIPGVRKEDINVQVEGSQVTISAEVKQDKEEKKNGRVLRSERRYGFASRSFTLANALDDAKSEARYDNGVLTLKLPKKPGKSGKRLEIA